ncbi:MAG: adenosine kinase [Acidimicrobiales bacterium]
MAADTLRYDVITVGSAIVDMFVHVTEDRLDSLGLVKGSMSLIDEGRALELVEGLEVASVVGGGSAANTAVGCASFGLSTQHIAVCADDDLGREYVRQLHDAGVEVPHPRNDLAVGTGRCIVMVTPDGERTMSTFLGASTEITASDVAPAPLTRGGLVYIEGYLLDVPGLEDALIESVRVLADSDTEVALSLSDVFVVERHRLAIEAMLPYMSHLFGNAAEAMALTGSATAGEAVAHLAARTGVAIVTDGAAGAWGATGTTARHRQGLDLPVIRDTTGAGDLFAAGYLAGVVREHSLEERLHLGNRSAAEVLGQLGARPPRALHLLLGGDALDR